MGISAHIEEDFHASLAALAWHIELGADEAICETPQSAYAMPEKTPWQTRAAAAAATPSTAAQSARTAAPKAAPNRVDGTAALAAAIAEASRIAAACADLSALDTAAAAFEHCDLRLGARGAVVGTGHANASLLVICDPPNIDAEKAGAAMDGGEMALLEAIFKAIGHSLNAPSPRDALYLAPALPWPLRGMDENRAAALAMMRPFALRRIALVAPKVVVIMGHESLSMMLQTTGLARARGAWHALPSLDTGPRARVMQDPAGISKSAAAKRAAWLDALAIKAALRN